MRYARRLQQSSGLECHRERGSYRNNFTIIKDTFGIEEKYRHAVIIHVRLPAYLVAELKVGDACTSRDRVYPRFLSVDELAMFEICVNEN